MSYRKKFAASALAVAIAASMTVAPAYAASTGTDPWNQPSAGVTLIKWTKPLILIDHAKETLHFQGEEGCDFQYRWQKPYQGIDDDWEFCSAIITLEKLGWTGEAATLQVRCPAYDNHTTSDITTQDFAARRESNTYDMPWVLKTPGYIEITDYTPNYRFALGQMDSDWKEAPFRFSVASSAVYTLYTRMPAAYNEYASKTVPVKRVTPMAEDGSVTLETRERAEWTITGEYGDKIVRNLVVSNEDGTLTVELPTGKDLLVHLASSDDYKASKKATIEKGRWLKIPKGGSAPNAEGVPTVYPAGVTMDLYNGTLDDIVYTVSFETNGGRTIDPIKVPYKGSIGANFPDFRQPRRSGYKFGGWYMDKNLMDDWDWDFDQVQGDMVLYARWVRDPNYVSDNDNDYTGSNGSNGSNGSSSGGTPATGQVVAGGPIMQPSSGTSGSNANGSITTPSYGASTNGSGTMTQQRPNTTTNVTGSQTTAPSGNGPKYNLNGSSSSSGTSQAPIVNNTTGAQQAAPTQPPQQNSAPVLPTRPVTQPSSEPSTPIDTRPTVDTSGNPLYGNGGGDATAATPNADKPTVTVDDAAAPTAKNPEKKGSALPIVGGVAAVGALGAAGYYFWKKQSDQMAEDDE